MVLVTGATGFLGRNLCPYLASRGHRLRALVRPSSNTGFLRDLGVELAHGDVCDLRSVMQAAQGCRRVVHAAGKFRLWGSREEFYGVNVEGTTNVVDAAVCADVERVVHVSSLAVVGAPREDQVLDEHVACEPVDDYQRSKLETEERVLAAVKESGLRAIVLRPGAFYGPWGRYAFNRLFFEDPLKGLPLGVHGGKRITFPIFVPDLARVIEASFSRGHPGEIYNVVGPCLSHARVHQTVSRLAGIRSWRINPPEFCLIWLARVWTYVARYSGAEPYYAINLAPYVFCDWNATSVKAEQELGFSPTPFEEGARQTLAWYKEQGVGPTNSLGRLVAHLWRLPNL